MFADLSSPVLALLLGGSLIAGLVDAIVGGGGLILIPLLLVAAPGLPEVTALATNKLAAVTGTGSAALRLLRTVKVDKKLLAIAVPVALLCSAGGSLLASMLSSAVLRPLVIVLLLAVGLYVALKPSFGASATRADAVSSARWVLALLAVGAIALYDGFFGPGTGTFLIIALTALLSRSFIESVAMTKVINTSTNLGALAVFIAGGHINWSLGLLLAVANMIGAQIGARLVVTKGTGFVRIALLLVVVIMSAKLGWDLYHGA